MIRIVVAGALALCLAGCVSPQMQARNDDRECRSMGAKPGSDIYVHCRMMKQQQHANEDMAFRNRMALVSASMNQQQRIQANCTSTRLGFQTQTTCY